MKVTLYTTHCPKCLVLEKKLNNANIKFDIVEDQDIMIEKGFMSAPVLEVDGEVLDFSKAVQWVNNATDNGNTSENISNESCESCKVGGN